MIEQKKLFRMFICGTGYCLAKEIYLNQKKNDSTYFH